MKVKMPHDWKTWMTVAEAEQAKLVIAYEKEDDEKPAYWAEMAAREALRGTGDYVDEVLKAEAEICKNSRAIWDRYGEGTGMIDVWITGTAKAGNGFIEFGAYLSDIWETGGTEYKDEMYIKEYIRK